MNIPRIEHLVLYTHVKRNPIIQDYVNLFQDHDHIPLDTKYYDLCSKLYTHEYYGIHDYLFDLILEDENPFTLNAELSSPLLSSLKKAALHDIQILQQIFTLQLDAIHKDIKNLHPLLSFNDEKEMAPSMKKLYHSFLSEKKIHVLYQKLCDFYYTHGVGQLSKFPAFIYSDSDELVPIRDFTPKPFDYLYGIDTQKQKLFENTQCFLHNKPFHHVLLAGASGTGKSSVVKAIVPVFFESKLRLIQMSKHQISKIPQLLNQLRDRGLYFILFIDDLSFEEHDEEYKTFKSLLQGSAKQASKKIAFYVTSNRVHLIKESITERDGDLHLSDSIYEKTSLAERFGLQLYYEMPNQEEYFSSVLKMAKDVNLGISEEELFDKARIWALQHGGRSGRIASQLISELQIQ